MKKKLLTVSVVLSLVLTSMSFIPVYAATDDIYFTTRNGLELTKDQYDNLSKVYRVDQINGFAPGDVDDIKNDPNLVLEDSDEVYSITKTHYDENGQVAESITTEVSEAEATRVANLPQTRGPYWETSSKVLELMVVNSGSRKKITLTNTWKTLPKVRSYDVIAVRITNYSIGAGDYIKATQTHNGGSVSYEKGSQNTRIPGILNHPGIGVSMNIIDNAYGTLTNQLVVTLINGSPNEEFKVYGTYQHAISSVTLSQSQDYDIGSGGLGNVLEFSSSVAGKYDGMQGVSANAKWPVS